jgi:hypothetical protein
MGMASASIHVLLMLLLVVVVVLVLQDREAQMKLDMDVMPSSTPSRSIVCSVVRLFITVRGNPFRILDCFLWMQVSTCIIDYHCTLVDVTSHGECIVQPIVIRVVISAKIYKRGLWNTCAYPHPAV